MTTKYTVGQVRKALVAALSFALVAISLALSQGGLIPDFLMKWAIFVITLGNVYGVYAMPNDAQTVQTDSNTPGVRS